jgi:2-iminobutanoate/2-iminopropanoate deaminase
MPVVGRPPFSWAEGLHYSQSIAVGGRLVLTAGQGGFDEAGEVVAGGFEAQLRQTFANLDAVLGSQGASLKTVARLTVYLVNAGDYDSFKRVRSEVLTAPFPASTAVVVAALLIPGMLVEIDAVAAVGIERQTA